MDSLEQLNAAMAYIEEELAGDIDMTIAARKALCSEYHLRRMFSFLAGISLSEYIRRRRLTLAALELSDGSRKVIDIAVKYGYSSPDAFTRAFVSLHGITPTEARNSGSRLKSYPRMTFQLIIRGGMEMKYRVEKKEAFHVVGIKNRIRLVPEGDNPDIVAILEATPEEQYARIAKLSNVQPAGILHVCANFSEEEEEGGQLDYYLAAATTEDCPPDLVRLDVAAYDWAVFEVEGSWEDVQEAWGRVYAEWFPSSGYEHAQGPEILSGSEEHKSEIWIPVALTRKT